MNLPETYAAVCAKRPDLAVEGLTYEACSCGWCGVRWHLREDGCLSYPKACRVREMLLARWVEALPVGYFIANTCSGFDVAVIDNYACVHWSDRPACPTPLEALAAYYLGETA